MTVIIQDFEIIPEPAPASDSSSSASGEQRPAPQPTPHEIALILRRQAERLARVRAD